VIAFVQIVTAQRHPIIAGLEIGLLLALMHEIDQNALRSLSRLLRNG
jgi:hypothetical protein